MADRTRLEVDRETQRRLRSLERRLARMASSIPDRGTTALRDATYPPAATVPEQVFLANRQILWYNTDRGWTESYYAPTGSAGLTARGLVAGAPAGWYPIGDGPKIRFAGSSVGPGAAGWREFGTWAALGNTEGTSWRNSSLMIWPSIISYVELGIAGRYDISGDMALPGGAGTIVLALSVFRPSLSGYMLDRQTGVDLISGYGQVIPQHHDDLLCLAGDRPHLRVYSSGTVSFGDATHQTFFSVKYIAPPLVTS